MTLFDDLEKALKKAFPNGKARETQEFDTEVITFYDESCSVLVTIEHPEDEREIQKCGKTTVTWNALIVYKGYRLQGIAKKLVNVFLSIFKRYDIKYIYLTDYSGGFWEHISETSLGKEFVFRQLYSDSERETKWT